MRPWPENRNKNKLNPKTHKLGLQANKIQAKVINKTRSGGVCLNDTTLQVGQHDMPFGGVGESGMGQYHGEEGFMAMSKLRPIFRQAHTSALSLMYPPYGKTFDTIIKLMLRL